MLGSIGRRNYTVQMTPELEKLCQWLSCQLKGYSYNYHGLVYPDDWERMAKALMDTFNLDLSKIKMQKCMVCGEWTDNPRSGNHADGKCIDDETKANRLPSDYDTVWIRDSNGQIRDVIYGGFATNSSPDEPFFWTKEECEKYYSDYDPCNHLDGKSCLVCKQVSEEIAPPTPSELKMVRLAYNLTKDPSGVYWISDGLIEQGKGLPIVIYYDEPIEGHNNITSRKTIRGKMFVKVPVEGEK